VNPWMTPPPDLPSLDSPEKDALIVALIARIDALVAENTALRTRVAELEAKLGLPPKALFLRGLGSGGLIEGHWVYRSVSCRGSIDHTICPLSCKFWHRLSTVAVKLLPVSG